MSLGPIEVIVAAFPGNQFNGQILPELERLVGNDTITIVDMLMLTKDVDGEVTFVDYDEIGANEDAARLTGLMDHLDDLLSEDDVDELANGLEPGSSAAVLVFEHSWAKPFRDAVVDSGGVLTAQFRVPGAVVEEVLESLAAVD